MRELLLINKFSGGGFGSKLIEEFLKNPEDGLTVRAIEFPLTDESRKEFETFDRVYVAGGDGTAGSVMGLLANSNRPIGFFPLGTANDLGREIRAPRITSFDACKKLLNAYRIAKDTPFTVWELKKGGTQTSSILFVNYFSLGFDASVACGFADLRKAIHAKKDAKFSVMWNRFLYTKVSFAKLLKFFSLEGVTLTADQKLIDFKLRTIRGLFFANVKSCLGLGVSNNVSNYSDEKIEVLEVRSVVNYLGMILGCRLPFISPKVLADASKIEISGLSPETFLQVDGEGCGPLGCDSLSVGVYGKVRILVLG